MTLTFNIGSNAPMAKATAEHLAAANAARQAQMDADRAEREIAERRRVEAFREPWQRVLAEVAAKHGITVGDLIGRSNRVPVRQARQEAMAQMVATGLSNSATARRLGRDPSTVWWGVRAHEARVNGLPMKVQGRRR